MKISEFLLQEVRTIREFAVIIGILVALNPGVWIGPLFWRRLEIEKSFWLKAYKGNFDRNIPLSETAKEDLNWWLNNVQKYPVKVVKALPSLTLTTWTWWTPPWPRRRRRRRQLTRDSEVVDMSWSRGQCQRRTR